MDVSYNSEPAIVGVLLIETGFGVLREAKGNFSRIGGDTVRILLAANSSNPHLRRIESVVSLANGCQRYYRLEFCAIDEFASTDVP